MKFDFHFLYVLACTFCINVVVMLVIGFIKPRATPFTFHDAFAVDMQPYRHVKIASVGILFAMIGVYAGLAEFGGYGTRWLAAVSYAITAAVHYLSDLQQLAGTPLPLQLPMLSM
ncbi:Uncharacterized symporter yidK [Klebsiella oxytoca]|nr:Uncharacterized symporter yidK [Klebsiella oxytoca]